MEDVYQRFNSYAFEKDEKFHNGLMLVDGSTPALEIKLFYYNRFIEPIDPAGYKQWSCGDPREIEDDIEDQNKMRSASEPGTSRDDSEEPEAMILSFRDVIRLVQAGETVPGQTHLDITPSNQNPTPSKMERVLKPWETR